MHAGLSSLSLVLYMLSSFTSQRIACKGRCPCLPSFPRCQCDWLLDPVCGTDGQSYLNPCYAMCSRAVNGRSPQQFWTCQTNILCFFQDVACKGKCPCKSSPNPLCICPAVIRPVCGVDGNFYQNSCRAACANTVSYFRNKLCSLQFQGYFQFSRELLAREPAPAK